LLGLLALAAAGFITVLTEAMPAGLLPQIGASLGIAPALVGQLVTVYAIGSLVAAIPLVALTRSWRRRPLLLLAIGGFAIVNTVTALSHDYALTLVARFFAGVFAGLLWALLAGQAARMVAPSLQGRAIAVAMLGAPLALSLGIPAGTLLGNGVGWRPAFLIMSALSVLLLGWVRWQVPDFPGQAAGRQQSVRRVFLLPGVRPVLAVMLAFVLAHNILYTYIAPFLAHAGLGERVDLVLLVFGAASILGIWVTGLLIDRWLRELVLAGTAGFGLAALLLGAATGSPAVVFVAVGVWGVSFGGAATLFQTASAQAAGDAADVAQSMVVTAWNIAIAGGGLIGGVLLQSRGAGVLPWSLVVLLVPALWLAWRACAHGFPRARAVAGATAQ
jgi:predicted MFS family arabinose efflux permease